MGHSVCQPPVQVMRLRRAVLKIPPKSSVPPRSPLYKLRSLLTPSESALPQVLIPLHFKSFISNAYKKRGVGCFRPAPKFGNSSLPAPLPSGHTRRPTTSITSFTSAHLPSPLGGGCPGGGGRHRFPAPPLHSSTTCHPEGIEGSAFLFAASRITDHGSPATYHSLSAPPLPQTCHPEGIEGSAFSSGFTDHWTRITGHGPTGHRTTAHERLGLSARLRALCASALSFSAFRCQALAGNRYVITSLLLCFTAPPCSRKDSD